MFEFNSKEINRDVTQEPLISEVNNSFKCKLYSQGEDFQWITNYILAFWSYK